jgi:ABC-type sugar transport system substrate-binding protein
VFSAIALVAIIFLVAAPQGFAAPKKILVGFCANDTGNEFITTLTNGVRDHFTKDGIETQIVNGAFNSETQIRQIENFAAMKANVVILIPVDPTSCKDAIVRAQAAGTKVLVLNSDTGAYDCIMHGDRFGIGKATAQLCADWVEKTFSNAKDSSVSVGIIEDRSNPEAAKDCDGMNEIGKLSTKIKVVQVLGGVQTESQSEDATSSMLMVHSDLKAILCFDGLQAIGVNAVVMRPHSPVADKSKFATFAADWSPEIYKNIVDSMSDKSVFRGSVKFGGDDLPGAIYALAKKMAIGEVFPKEQVDPYIGIDSRNVDKYKDVLKN